MTTRRFAALAGTALLTIALAACGGNSEAEATGPHGFDTQADYNTALTTHACDLADGGKNSASVIKTLQENPEVATRYGYYSDADLTVLFNKMLRSHRSIDVPYDCSNTMVKEATILDIETSGYFNYDYAVDNGIVEDGQ